MPARVFVYIEERIAPPTKADYYYRIPINYSTGLDAYAVSHIFAFFGWAPAISKMTSLGSNAQIV